MPPGFAKPTESGPHGVLVAVLLVVLALSILGCEPIRPLAPASDDQSRATALRKASKMLANDQPLPLVAELLAAVKEETEDDEERERAARLLIELQIQWYQLAHISHDLLTKLPGYNRVFNTLRDHLRGDDTVTQSELGRVPDGLKFLRPLVGAGRTGANPTSVKRDLVAQLSRHEASPEFESRQLATAARLFLNLESGWRYSRNWRAPVSRVNDLKAFVSRDGAGPLADNAWLTLKLSFSLALDEPSLPSRQLTEAAAALSGRLVPADARTGGEFLAIWSEEGATMPEALWFGWRAMRTSVDRGLDDLAAGLEGDGLRTWSRLSDYLELSPAADSPTAAELFMIAEPVRSGATLYWLNTRKLAPLTTGKAIDAFENRIRNTWRARDARNVDRRTANFVVACLGTVQAAAHRLGDRVRGRALRLLDRGEFRRRSLILPGGAVYRAFPSSVEACLAGTKAGCLRGLVEELVARGSKRSGSKKPAKKPAKRPAVKPKTGGAKGPSRAKRRRGVRPSVARPK
ncbi:MAG: hypothetical protein ACI9OJ_001728 [Myxococcota bacterium]|jgi:hypothetical protein